jgi:nitrate/TMAO reductase-like tetraheme cytochrome c subunit
MYEKSSHMAAFKSAGLPGCVVCHSNHDIKHPTDAKLDTGPQGVCMQCHTPGDSCDQARAKMLANLTNLAKAIKDSDTLLSAAESSGMEVSQARLDEDQARDALTKARVTIHSFREDLVNQDIQEGLKSAAKNLQAGRNALAERDYRRRGLGVAVLFILLTVVGLFLYIRQSEREVPKA